MQALLECIAALPPPDYAHSACRIFHGRGGCFPGSEHLTLDWFAPVWLLTSFAPLPAPELAALGAALQARWREVGDGRPFNWVYQCRAAGQLETTCMAGAVPEPHIVAEGGAQFRVQLLRGQNHGLFLDMAAGRAWVRQHIASHAPARVLNLFAYTCAFSVVALQAGAHSVVNVDMSHAAMAMGQQNHQLNGVAAGARFLAHDLFSSWGKVGRGGPYDLVIADPPSYQKGSFVATKDYPRLLRRLPDLLMPDGLALICLNAPELDADFLHQHMQAQAPEMQFVERIANPAVFCDVAPERALKVLVYRYSGR